MNGLFTVKEWTMLIVRITKPDGKIRCCQGGAMVVITVGDMSWRAVKIGSSFMTNSRDALHDALRNHFPGLKKVVVPKGEINEVCWAAIVDGYHRQISP